MLEKDLVGDRGAEELKVRAGSYPSTTDLRRLVSSFRDALILPPETVAWRSARPG